MLVNRRPHLRQPINLIGRRYAALCFQSPAILLIGHPQQLADQRHKIPPYVKGLNNVSIASKQRYIILYGK